MQYTATDNIINYLSHVNTSGSILHVSKDYINKSTKNSENTEYNLFYGWLLFTTVYKDEYFYDCAWQEPLQNKILEYFNIEYDNNTYRNDDIHIMWCVYYTASLYNRNIKDYERFLPIAQSTAKYLIDLKNAYDNIIDELHKIITELTEMPFPSMQASYIISEHKQKIYNIISNVSYSNYICNIDTVVNCGTLTFNMDIKESKSLNSNYFYRVKEQLNPLFNLLQENIDFYNETGDLFSFNNRFIIE